NPPNGSSTDWFLRAAASRRGVGSATGRPVAPWLCHRDVVCPWGSPPTSVRLPCDAARPRRADRAPGRGRAGECFAWPRELTGRFTLSGSVRAIVTQPRNGAVILSQRWPRGLRRGRRPAPSVGVDSD